MNGVSYFFSILFPYDLQNYIFQSTMKCKMTSFYITSLHVDLNKAAKCVDVFYHDTTHIVSLLIASSHTRTKYKMVSIFGLVYEDSSSNL